MSEKEYEGDQGGTMHNIVIEDDKVSNESNPSKEEESKKMEIETEMSSDSLVYKVSENPPIHLLICFAFQNVLVVLPWCLTMAIIMSEIACARDLETFKMELLCTTIFISGITTFIQVTVGVRIPVYQGPTQLYTVPLLALAALPEWKCPDINLYSGSNSSVINGTTEMFYRQEVVYPRLNLLQGSLALAGGIHMLIGFTGTMGLLLKYIGPITIIPAIFLSGVSLYGVLVKFSETHWGISALTTFICILLSLYLERHLFPLPKWNREKGFHFIRYPLHQVLCLLIAITCGWAVSAVLTEAGVFSKDPKSKEFYARTDSRLYVIDACPLFHFPYPEQFGKTSFDTGVFVGFMSATFISILDSIADYYATARVSRVPPPPVHAINRGLFVEGMMSMIAGPFGCGHATTTYGSVIGIIGTTRVASRRVYQCLAIILIILSIIGKFGAVFITIPYPVLGGTQLVGLGIFLGLVLSNLQYIDIASTRNLAIIGISILMGMMIPYWVRKNSHLIDTGFLQLDSLIKMLMSNPNLIGGSLGCFLDNTVPGTDEERGLVAWMGMEQDEESKESKVKYLEGLEVYDFLPEKIKQIKWLEYLPISPTYKARGFKFNYFRKCRKNKKPNKVL